MAFVTTEDVVIRLAGFEPAMIMVKGSYTNSGGGTGGIISPGYTNSSGSLTAIGGSAAIGARKILTSSYTQGTNDAVTLKEVIAFNSTRGRFESTITTSADSVGTYTFLCQDNGA